MKQKLIAAKNDIITRHGNYLATEVFLKERRLLGRINKVLLYRYNYLG